VDGNKLGHFYTYLGSRVTYDADCTTEVKLRLAMGMVLMLKIWKNKSVSTLTKLSLIKSLVWSVNCNIHCESWALKKEEERHIQAFENKRIMKLFLNSMDKTDDK